jgi:hypothetical protein
MFLKFVCWAGVVEKKFNFWAWISLSIFMHRVVSISFEICAEFGEIFSFGKHCWSWLSTQRIRFDFCSFWHFSLFIPQIINYGLTHVCFWSEWIVGIVTRRPLVLQLHKMESGTQEYAEFLHLPRRKFTDFGMTVTLHSYTIKLCVLINRWTAYIFWFAVKQY